MGKDFIAIDGESITLPSGIDILTIMEAASSRGHVKNIEAWKSPGLRTCECMDYLMSLNEKPNRIFVMFGFGWDINMMLWEINASALKALKRTKRCFFSCNDGTGEVWCVEHLPRKIFTLSRGLETKQNGRFVKYEIATFPGTTRKKRMQIYDTWGFFQTSFVKALEDWLCATRQELDAIQEMKLLRGNFDKISKSQIRDYNLTECVKLAQMMEKVDAKVTEGLGIKLRSFHGAGAIAGQLLQKHKARNYLPRTEHDSLLHAYFGGRIQTIQLGHFQNVYSYDIRSAYPFIMSTMPRFLPERIRQVSEISPWDCVRVRWNIPYESRITPFPFRLADGSIQFYRTGEGYYHASEVIAALKIWPKHIEILEIWRIPYDDSQRPFAWIEELYEYRAMIRKAGDLAHIAIKLGLNALYGKTAQKQGCRGHEPPYRSFMVAGATTAGCRAMLLNAANQSPDSMIMFATDGIACTTPLDLPFGSNLGEWEEESYDELRVYQAGLYVYAKGDELKQKTRSLLAPGFASSTDEERKAERVQWWQEISDAWIRDGTSCVLERSERHFIGYGQASSNLPWRQWVQRPKRISFYPSKGFPVEQSDGNYRLQPLAGLGGMSRIYVGRDDDAEES